MDVRWPTWTVRRRHSGHSLSSTRSCIYYSSDNANPSRVHTLASRAADHLAAARQAVARFINAADASEVVFVRGTTEGVNLVASASRGLGEPGKWQRDRHLDLGNIRRT